MVRDEGSAGKPRHAPPIVWAGLGLAVALDVAVQLCWKSCVAGAPESAGVLGTLVHTATRPMTAALGLLFAVQLLNWSRVLSRADLSFAQPLTAASFPLVMTIAWLALGEHVGPLRFVGVAFILAGAWAVGGTPARTAGSAKGAP